MTRHMLKGKIAVVTGGTRGIGRAIAEKFLEQGATVAIFGTNQEKGEATAKEMQSLCQEGALLKFYQANVASKEQLEKQFADLQESLGPVDILVNNAGITRDTLFMRMKDEHWDEVLETNLTSIYHTCQAVVRPMMKARYGKIINITSVVGVMGNAGQANYSASKAGMIGFSKSLAKELASRGISVNCIAPGFIQTDMTDAIPEKNKEMLMSQIPMGRLGQGEDIANAALFLASPMGNYVTGQVITVDGGMTM